MWHSAILVVASWHIQCGTVPQSKWHCGILIANARGTRASTRMPQKSVASPIWHVCSFNVSQCHIQKGNVADSTWHAGRLERRAPHLRGPPRVETSYLPIGGVVEFVSLLPDRLAPAAPYQEARQEQERLSCRLSNTSGGWNKPSHAQTATQRQP